MATYLGQPASNEKEYIENNPPVTIFYLSDGTKRFSEKKGSLDPNDLTSAVESGKPLRH